MNIWMLALLALLPAFAAPVFTALRGTVPNRLVAVQLAVSIAAQILVVMTFAFNQSAFADLPLAIVLLSLPGSLLFAMFLERWL